MCVIEFPFAYCIASANQHVSKIFYVSLYLRQEPMSRRMQLHCISVMAFS